MPAQGEVYTSTPLPVDRQSPVKTTFLQLLLRTVIRKNSVEFLFTKNVIEIFSSETLECFQNVPSLQYLA